jgi:hypothetical protein
MPGAAMDKTGGKEYDLGRSGTVTCYLSDDKTRLLIAFDIDERGFTKTGLNGFIDVLKKIREKMVR